MLENKLADAEQAECRLMNVGQCSEHIVET